MLIQLIKHIRCGLDSKIENIWAQDYVDHSLVDLDIMQQNTSSHSSVSEELYVADASPQ